MWDFLAFAGLGLMVIAVIAVIRPTPRLYMPTRSRGLAALAFGLVLLVVGAVQSTQHDHRAIAAVAPHLTNNKLGVGPSDLQTKANPNGEGVYVYSPQTEWKGVERLLVWLVLDGEAHPLNGASKDVTPDLSWPREVPAESWKRTGLDPITPKQSLDEVFGRTS